VQRVDPHDTNAKPLRCTAIDVEGFTQAVETPDHEFVVSVQWHPEDMPYFRNQRKLFAAFASAVKAFDMLLARLQDE